MHLNFLRRKKRRKEDGERGGREMEEKKGEREREGRAEGERDKDSSVTDTNATCYMGSTHHSAGG